MPVSRLRPFLLAAAVAVALAACSDAPPPAAQAPAPEAAAAEATTPAAHADVHRLQIGALSALVLRDGDIRFPNNGEVVAIGQPKTAVDALLEAGGLPLDTLHLSVQSLLVRSGDRVVLFDTGAGDAAFADAGRLPASLQAAGIAPEAVTDIFISHAHGDHVGGLLAADGTPAFANAAVRMSQPEWQALQGDAAQARLVEAIAPQVQAFAPGAAGIVPGVSAEVVAGHTPGHSAYRIVDGDDRLLYIGDAAHHHLVSVQRPRWTIAFDGDAPVAEDSREALLARAADEGLRIASPHFPYPGLGRIERRDGGFVWVATD